MDRERKADLILGIYNQRRMDIEERKDNNEQKIRKIDEKIEQLYYLDKQIRNLIEKIYTDVSEKDRQFMFFFEEYYLKNYQREIEQLNGKKEDLMKEKKQLYNLEDEYKRECDIELRKIE